MDFASLMSAQIAKSKPSSDSNGPKTYTKRGQAENERLLQYQAELKKAEDERAAKLSEKRKHAEEEADKERLREEKRRRLAEESRLLSAEEERVEENKRRKRLGLPPLPDATLQGAEGTPIPEGEDMDDAELCAKLRQLDEPARLFDETHARRLKRYKRIAERALAPVMSKGPIPTTLELVPEAEMKIPDAIPSAIKEQQYLYRQLASYFTMIFTEWQIALARRDEATKTSSSGRAAYSAMTQARGNMVPLFRKFEKGEVEKSILAPIVEIVKCCQSRRYVDANDAYLRLSIGKAAWPIGVTMVGIHERSAREKLHASDNAAHIMSDEITRKFLQSIKRCLSFAQTRWPPDDQLQLMG